MFFFPQISVPIESESLAWEKHLSSPWCLPTNRTAIYKETKLITGSSKYMQAGGVFGGVVTHAHSHTHTHTHTYTHHSHTHTEAARFACESREDKRPAFSQPDPPLASR